MKEVINWLTLLIFCFAVSCSQKQVDTAKAQVSDVKVETKDAKVIDGKFVHVVLFWLKKPTDKIACTKFESSLNNFIDNSEFVTSMHIGKPAGTDREVVDNSYTYSLIVSFDSKEAHDKYQAEAVHKKFVEECADLWDKVQIYDSIHF